VSDSPILNLAFGFSPSGVKSVVASYALHPASLLAASLPVSPVHGLIPCDGAEVFLFLNRGRGICARLLLPKGGTLAEGHPKPRSVCFLVQPLSKGPSAFDLALFCKPISDLKDLVALIWLCFGFVSLGLSHLF
jgi:hypothetical protein